MQLLARNPRIYIINLTGFMAQRLYFLANFLSIKREMKLYNQNVHMLTYKKIRRDRANLKLVCAGQITYSYALFHWILMILFIIPVSCSSSR